MQRMNSRTLFYTDIRERLSEDAEGEANSFASEFLMPQADLLASASRVQTFSDLVKAKRRWGVSVAALNYALHKIGIIRDWQYKSKLHRGQSLWT